ncbi:indole-3-acetaldehyde oxidase-like isoform X1 [Bombyx mandarina]|uniref:Indole-3-acetaldehyde oxidase n=1 Tax=Bombyx mandarina TaxID=7092 RepID=A0A6J2JQV3_BOMMA|nr:indole-3-acetaldehyde oxidase-like isoform X1 [Bombyx mandarina]
MDKIKLKINDKHYTVDGKFGPDVSLNEFIRNVAELRGTKAMCHEGGCGACVVAVRASLPPNNEMKTFAVNSCLVSILSCHEWEVITVEGIGNKSIGYHEIQTRLANFNGTQCGFCTPGWVMNMYSIYQSKNKKLSQKEIENSFAGNICRCTGYRPIADAFKSFAKDADHKLLNKICDLEDLTVFKACGFSCKSSCKRTGCKNKHDEGNVEEDFAVINDCKTIEIDCGTHKWFKTYKLDDVFKVMARGDYKLVAGNTGQGVYHIKDYPTNVIDIFNVSKLKSYVVDVNLIIGAGTSLADMMELFLKLSSSNEEFRYLKHFHDHMDLVAHIPVRNIGTIAGNLMLKHDNREFQSDVFLLFETVQAMITIASSATKEITVTLPEFLEMEMNGKIVLNVILPPLSNKCKIKTFKIMPRSQNAHAVVNAGFLFHFKHSKNELQNVSIVYGGISPDFIHASKTEALLINQNPFTDKTLQMALKSLNEELKPKEMPPEPSAAYRKMLALALYYKAILSLSSESINPIYKSGGEVIKRSVSHGTQSFETDKEVWPLNQPVPKLEALVQCSGEAVFANDLPKQSSEVFGAFVTADTTPGSIIKDFDTEEAFKIPGVIAFYTAKNIPGINSFVPISIPFAIENEELLCEKTVKYYGQPAAIIVADREKTANKAAGLVKIKYDFVNKEKLLLTIDEVLNSPKRKTLVRQDMTVQPTDSGSDISTVIEGSMKIHAQYHYTMETQTSVATPTEDGLEIYSSTQWLDLTNIAIAKCLDMPVNSINIIVRRLGGGYGSKITRASQIACAAALVTRFLGRTCRFILPLQTNMKAIGKRIPTNCEFEIGVNKAGRIQNLKNTFYQDGGCSFNEVLTPLTVKHFQNCYDSKRWFIQSNSVKTDNASNTWCRSPCSTEGVAMIEQMMEMIAFYTKNVPLNVRLQNMSQDNNPLPEMIDQLIIDANYDERVKEVKKFNNQNRWRKRGINLLPLSSNITYFGLFNCIISVYHGDGSVVITHGGIEMGQGINTKAAQVCAYTLGIKLEKISVKPSSSFTSPNNMVTGGSIGSECVSFAVMKACNELNNRLAPIKEKLNNPSWEQLIVEANAAGINLQVASAFSPVTDGVKPYDVYAVGIIEVEVDILTGNHEVLRVDILEDTGRSLSPEIDIAQIEGGFIMGLGYWTSEKLMYDSVTGKLLTDRTWNYKPPGIKDIPADMRIYFRRNAINEFGVLQSKATGEPSFCLAIGVTHAIREAIRSSRLDAGYEDKWLDIDLPFAVENIFMAAGNVIEHFKLT